MPLGGGPRLLPHRGEKRTREHGPSFPRPAADGAARSAFSKLVLLLAAAGEDDDGASPRRRLLSGPPRLKFDAPPGGLRTRDVVRPVSETK
jgi:hypothetical protein